MKNFFAAFVGLLMAGWLFLLIGGELGGILFCVAVAALIVALLAAVLVRQEALEQKLDALARDREAPAGPPPEAPAEQ